MSWLLICFRHSVQVCVVNYPRLVYVFSCCLFSLSLSVIVCTSCLLFGYCLFFCVLWNKYPILIYLLSLKPSSSVTVRVENNISMEYFTSNDETCVGMGREETTMVQFVT